jgi:hypothetical protein
MRSRSCLKAGLHRQEQETRLLQQVFCPIKARLDADFVVAGRGARDGGTADNFIARFDRKPSADCYYAWQRHLLADNGITVVEALGIDGGIGAVPPRLALAVSISSTG